jgi:hypothetical protein
MMSAVMKMMKYYEARGWSAEGEVDWRCSAAHPIGTEDGVLGPELVDRCTEDGVAVRREEHRGDDKSYQGRGVSNGSEGSSDREV